MKEEHVGTVLTKISCPQPDEKARMEKSQIRKCIGCLENVVKHIQQESATYS